MVRKLCRNTQKHKEIRTIPSIGVTYFFGISAFLPNVTDFSVNSFSGFTSLKLKLFKSTWFNHLMTGRNLIWMFGKFLRY